MAFAGSGPTFGSGAFGSSNAFASAAAATGNAQPLMGPELEEVHTEALGFQTIAGESKLRLLPSSWPSGSYPPPTASLLSIASNKGVLAAGGPDSVVISSTESVRDAFKSTEAGGDIKSFSPQLTLSLGTSISQVAFSSDENFLAISAQVGGGLAFYELQGLTPANTRSTFELGTDGVSIRALVPSPGPDSLELFAVVTLNGDLMLASTSTRQFVNGANGPVLKDKVSSISWSTRGKQLVAGLGDGTAVQMKPDGTRVAEIPRPSGIDGDQHVSAISWLENDIFLLAYTPTSFADGMAPVTSYFLVTRQKPNFTFQKLPEVCGPWGLNRSPPFQFMQRLKDWDPNLRDAIIVASTASQDVGLFTRSKVPLSSASPQEKITDQFTTTQMANDSRRAQMPMTEDMSSDTSPIGMALDLSSKSNVPRPLPGEEMDESSGPLPGLMILNHEGILSAWWFVYAEAVRQGVGYRGLAINDGQRSGQTKPPNQPQAQQAPMTSAFRPSAFGLTSTPSAPASSSFGSSAAFASPNPGFGAPAAVGAKTNPWSSASTPQGLGNTTSNQSSFGAPTPLGGSKGGAMFGAASGLGQRNSPWGAATQPTTTSSAFGQTSTLGSQASAFGQTSTMGPQTSAFGNQKPSFGQPQPFGSSSSGGFASFSKQGGFAAKTLNTSGESVLKQSTPNTSFTSEMETGSSFGTPQKSMESSGIFGTGSSSFQLVSSWKNQDAGKVEADKAQTLQAPGNSLFGTSFNKALGDTVNEANTPPSREETMDSDLSDTEPPKSPESAPSRPDATTPAPASRPPTEIPSETPPQTLPPKFVAPTPNEASTTPQEPISQVGSRSQGNGLDSSPLANKHPPEQKEIPKVVSLPPEPPLPPDPTTKTSYTPTNSTVSSTATSKASTTEAPAPTHSTQAAPEIKKEASPPVEDAPLPPDWIMPKAASKLSTSDTATTPTDDAPLPPDPLPSNIRSGLSKESSVALPNDREDGIDDEGSGVDVGQEFSSPTDQSPQISPESSFSKPIKGSAEGLFSRTEQSVVPTRPLFGEIGAKSSAPIFPPPNKIQQSPRSPSPVRLAPTGDMLRPDPSRSFSAPGAPPTMGAPPRMTVGRPTRHVVPQAPATPYEDTQKAERERLLRERNAQREQEEQELSDGEDERVRQELESEVEATLSLEPFLAHQDYVGNISKPGIPGQIEKVYRDINSMIDTLGLNCRSLQGFIKGNIEMLKESGRDIGDLERNGEHDEWCLVEIDDLSTLEDSLARSLEHGRVKDVNSMTASIEEISNKMSIVRAKQNDIKRVLSEDKDPKTAEATRFAPLSAEQSVMRNDLRTDFASFQKLLGKAEGDTSMLRAKLAAARSSSGTTVPTAEAVERTIRKMTGMAEKRSGDIDVLEAQMRRLDFFGPALSKSLVSNASSGLRSSGAGGGVGGVGDSPDSSRENSPFVTPPTSMRRPGPAASTNGTPGGAGGAFFTPRSSLLGDSASARGSPAARRRTPGSAKKWIMAVAAAASDGQQPQQQQQGQQQEGQGQEARFAAKVVRRREVNRLMRDALLQQAECKVRGLD